MVRLTDRLDMTLDVYRGRKTTTQQQQPLEAISDDDWLHTDAGRDITTFDWLNDVTDLPRNTFAALASSDKIAFVFHLFDDLHALKPFYNA